MKVYRLTASCAFLLALSAHATAKDAAEGRALLEAKCARCHAIGMSGKSPSAPAPPFREVVKRYDPEVLAEAFGEGIVTGHPAMPEFEFSVEEIDALLAYFDSLKPTP